MNTDDIKHDDYGDDSDDSGINISIADLSKKRGFQGDDSEKTTMDVVLDTPKPLGPLDKLKFAKGILICVGVIFVVTGIANISIQSDVAGQVWNFVSAVANSLVAVIIGYYFGKDK